MGTETTTERRAPSRAGRLAARLARAGRWPLAIGLAATLLGTALVPPAPAQAQGPIIRDHRFPAARIQLVVNKVHVYDDRDGRFAGDGEMTLYAGLWEVDGGLTGSSPVISEMKRSFGAGSGDDVVLDQIVPGDGDMAAASGVTTHAGIPVFAGRQYVFATFILESDSLTASENLGAVKIDVNEANGWGIGSGEVRSVQANGKAGDYAVTYEIRRTPLPDLVPTAFRVAAEAGRPGGDAQICWTTENRGPLASEPFQVVVEFGGAEQTVLTTGASELGAGETREQCTSQRLPEPGTHPVTVTIDPERGVPEMDEDNNVFKQTVVRTPTTQSVPTPVPSPGPDSGPILIASQGKGKDDGQGDAQTRAPGQAQADLSVSGIKVNGQVPDGKDDCKDGKNAVTIVLKNAGSGKASTFAVRLTLDGDEVDSAQVDGLDAGKEREVSFGEVRLKKGSHKLAATVDAKNTVAEASDENNDRTVTVGCGGNG